MLTQPINQTNHRGIPIAEYKAKGINSCYKLYKIQKTDQEFLKDLYDSVDLQALMPNMHEYEYINWDGILKEAINQADRYGRSVFIETCDDKPCGVINFSDKKDFCYLNFIATFPTEPKKRVPFAGQVLFNALFKNVLETVKHRWVELSALRYAPFSPISTYLKLGFKSIGGDGCTEQMRISRAGIQAALDKQDAFISSKTLEKQDDIDLYTVIKLNK